MVTSIDFDNESFALRYEIYNIISNDKLTIKTRTYIKCAQRHPKDRLCHRLILPVFLSKTLQYLVSVRGRPMKIHFQSIIKKNPILER